MASKNYTNQFQVHLETEGGFTKVVDIEAETCAEARLLAVQDIDDGSEVVTVEKIYRLIKDEEDTAE